MVSCRKCGTIAAIVTIVSLALVVLTISSLLLYKSFNTPSFCWMPWSFPCPSNYQTLQDQVILLRRQKPYNAFLFALTNMVQHISIQNSYLCYDDDGIPRRSLYIDYSKPPFPWITEFNKTDLPGWDECYWQFRCYQYEIQLTISRFLKASDPDLLSEMVCYNVSDPNLFYLNQTLNCYNLIYHLPHPLVAKLRNYTIDFKKIPPEDVKRWVGWLNEVAQYTYSKLGECQDNAQQFQDEATTVFKVIAIASGVALFFISLGWLILVKMLPKSKETDPLIQEQEGKIGWSPKQFAIFLHHLRRGSVPRDLDKLSPKQREKRVDHLRSQVAAQSESGKEEMADLNEIQFLLANMPNGKLPVECREFMSPDQILEFLDSLELALPKFFPMK